MGGQMSAPSVLVVGAGPTGLVLACELARRRVAFRIVDRSVARAGESRALAIHARSLEVLEDVGALGALLEAGLVWRAASFYSKEDRIARIRFDRIDGAYPFILSLPQRETERILGEHLERLGGRVVRGVELIALSQGELGARATLRSGDGRDEQIEVPWLVGCDGAHSAVRHAIAATFDGSPYEEKLLLADVVVRAGLARDESHAYLSNDGPCVLLPLPGDGAFRVVAEEVVDLEPELSLATFQRLLDERGPGRILLESPSWMARFRIHHRLTSRYRSGSVLLAGDAAHIHSPVGGQGMNTGMQDAYNLAWKLDLVIRGRARATLLDTYEAERRPVAHRVIFGTDRATRAAFLRRGALLRARNEVARLLTRIEAVERRLATTAAELAVSYRRSPIVREDRGLRARTHFARGPRPGERAPDAALEGGGRLHERLRGTSHVLLVFGENEAIAKRALARLGEDLRVLRVGSELPDPGEALHRRYGARPGSIVLVRPDKYVGYRAEPADQDRLDAYLARIFV
jgi:2-polyprenyl-6-methoxyphenol hydroxylase-like FAD-dependent oxidoreductase